MRSPRPNCLKYLISSPTQGDATAVGEQMTRDVQTLDAEASLDDAAGLFCSESVRRFPVVSEGRLVGILSRRDLIRFVRDVRRQAAAR